MPAAFEVRQVCYAYNQTPVLHDFSIDVQKGERIALLGANGSGKSTLLRLLAGLSFPQSGGICFFGEELSEARLQGENFFFAFRKRVGVVFQNPDVQLFNASVFDEIAFGPLQLKWPKTQIRNRVEEIMVRMGVADLRHRAPHRLSGGEKKRVALASVLVLDPEVLLLDEPAAALDPGSQNQVIELLSSWTDGSRTVITATHDLAAIENIADRCYLLESGRVAGEGDPLAILHDVPLLQRTRLIRPHEHVHGPGTSTGSHPHPHLHSTDIR